MPRHASPTSASVAELVAVSSYAEVSETLAAVADLDDGPLRDLLDLMAAAAVATGRRRPAWDRCMATLTAVQDLSGRIAEASAAIAALPTVDPAAAAE
ncbi:hypothetical protein [Streptacidiphilus jiangxiensis]|uniref:Uncharacterized protein n=1 Tax=Streptacidiphilus jiangxiensis TaxID=235985 RepID=A0A1H8A7R3_STRJI|nr:hypothetical protein [Streptacidiphilus jiangxiensis]SEM65944.1 hypothetical protein SAMN05414137_14126 [Streptacidiphilus jiangxiensis]